MRRNINVKVAENGLWLDSNITYGQTPGWFGNITNDLKMSIIRHFEGRHEKFPCIVWLCGGGWMQMDWNAHLPNFFPLVKRGYVLAGVEYRCDAEFPAQLEQVKLAIRYLRAHAGRYRINPDRMGVMGESAGGHLAGLVGTTGNIREFDKGEYLEYSSAVQAVCSWYMPADFNTLISPGGNPAASMHVQRLLGCSPADNPGRAAWASPVTYITAGTPPFLLLHGAADKSVPFSQSEQMHDALEAKGVPAELYGIEGADHAGIEFFQPEIMDIIGGFFDKWLKA